MAWNPLIQNPANGIELYHFSGGSADEFYLTPHEHEVTLGGITYVSLPVERSTLALGAEDGKTALTLKLPPDCDLVRYLLRAGMIGNVTSVELKHALDIGGVWTPTLIWIGRVLGLEVADDIATVRCEAAQVSLKRIALRRLYSRRCAHVLYSAACGVATSGHEMAVFVSGVSGRTIHLAAPLPNANVNGGWLWQGSPGRRHMIIGSNAFSVELLHPAPIQIGDAYLIEGCDHTMQTCHDRFGNLDNYGGFPFIPVKNPFETGVF